MRPFRSRQVIVVLVASAVGAGSLLAPEPALALKSLFRAELQFYGAPFPAVTTPGGAGVYQAYIQPYTYSPYAEATVEAGNPIGGAFKLPSSFISYQGTYTATAKTAFPGYTTISAVDYYNGEGRFGPNNGAASPIRVVFPTTGGNPTPNYGDGNPVTPTATFSGRYDFSRAGSINITPGPNRFGGTMRLIDRLGAGAFYQYIYKFAPAYYKVYGSFRCQRAGITCTGGSAFDTEIGEITSSGMATRFLLNVKGTGTGMRIADNTAKATTPTSQGAMTFPTVGGQGTPTNSGPASYIVAKNYYLHLLHPWTTGFASAYNYLETPVQITPQKKGYDVQLGGADITVTHIYTSANFNTELNTVTYTQYTYKQYMNSVHRVVSMVRPRLKHVYQKPLDPATDPITTNFQAARLWTMRVFFVPEAGGMLLLGAGIAALLGLSRIRRR